MPKLPGKAGSTSKEVVSLSVMAEDFDYMRDGLDCYEYAIGSVNHVLEQLGYPIQFDVKLLDDEEEDE